MAAAHCTGCGRIAAACGGCGPELDPPRFCARCGRRLTVVVTPAGWRGRCNRCGAEVATGDPNP